MKKIIAVFIIVALSLLSVCFLIFRTPYYKLETLTTRFNECYNEIELIIDKNNLESELLATDESQSLNKYYIRVTDKSRIDIEFSTNATETRKGNGTFSISYTISDVSDDNNFDVELFKEIVNSISGKAITTDFVTEFLTAPEEKYSVEKYGINGGSYDVEKMHALNFWEDWVIGYELIYDNHAELWFYGYIK